MENLTFRDPAVAGIMREKFVEARLHTDGEEPQHDQVRALRDELTSGNQTTPIYIIVDPTSGEQLARLDGSYHGKFIDMIRKFEN